MFDAKSLLEDVFAGFPVLLVGSGFSAAATNASGLPLPTGGGLSKLLHGRLAYTTTTYPLDTVSREFVRAFGEHELLALLQDRLTAATVTADQQAALTLPWKRVYTTNYDNVLELSHSWGTGTQIINGATQPLSELHPERPAIIHINGRLHGTTLGTLNSSLRLTRASYLSEAFLASPWFGQLRRDLSVATAIVIIGYSVADIDIARLLYSDPTLHSRTYFIETLDLDPVLQRELEEFGSVLTIGLSGFSNEIVRAPAPKRHPTQLRAFQEYTAAPSTAGPSGDDVLNLLLVGAYSRSLQASADAANSLYSTPRTAVADLISRLKSGETYFLLHSDLGNGKTIAIEQLARSLAREKYRPLILRDSADEIAQDLANIHGTNNTVIVVEDLFRHSKVVSHIVSALPKVPVVVTTRSAIYELHTSRVDDIIGHEYVAYDLNRLDRGEIDSLTQLFDENGLWADFSVSAPAEKRHLISYSCKGEIRNVLIKLFESPSIKKRIVDAFSEQIDRDVLSIVVCSLILDVAGFDPDLYMLNQLTGVDVFKKRDKVNNVFSLEFLDSKYGKVAVKSSVLGEYALQKVVNSEFVLQCLINIVKRCEHEKAGTSQISKIYADLQKEVMRFSLVDRVFARKTAGDIYKRFYDAIRSLPSMSRNPQFWLQFAIARMEDKNYHASLILFKTAYSHARAIKNYNTFQIDNHYARYLLESRTHDPGYRDDFVIFVEAHQLLVKQARKERGAYYPFKVARNYLAFFRARGASYDVDQKRVLSGAASEILDEISKIPRTAQKYYVIDECRNDLTELIELITSKAG